jgi:methyltransferase OMS1
LIGLIDFAEIGWDEFFMGIKMIRWWLISNASGNVLEVAAGTGLNLPYYKDEKCDKIVLTDSSEKMVEMLRSKAQGKFLPLSIRKMDASSLQFADQSFDTVIDTFGICSFEDPIVALKEIKRVCKPDGKILLLEHGESDWNFMRESLKYGSIDHLEKWGCYWNRDIQKLVEDAGLEIKSCWRAHFGTTYVIVAKPKA